MPEPLSRLGRLNRDRGSGVCTHTFFLRVLSPCVVLSSFFLVCVCVFFFSHAPSQMRPSALAAIAISVQKSVGASQKGWLSPLTRGDAPPHAHTIATTHVQLDANVWPWWRLAARAGTAVRACCEAWTTCAPSALSLICD